MGLGIRVLAEGDSGGRDRFRHIFWSTTYRRPQVTETDERSTVRAYIRRSLLTWYTGNTADQEDPIMYQNIRWC